METKTTITHGNKRLIDSNSFFTFDEGETNLLLEYKGDCVKFVFEVINDESDIKNSIKSQVSLPDTLRITIRNFRIVMGNAVLGPIELGEIAGHQFYMLLRVSGAKSQGAKLITYSVYVEGGQ